jgi:2-polyprenyl-3-methyl-5-hydroxy-6-metoxy-1,4-benzoquinol methylase
VCAGNSFTLAFKGKIINGFNLIKCRHCEMIIAHAIDNNTSMNYKDYGEYLILEINEIHKRVEYIKNNMKPIFDLLRRHSANKLLDFGSGAGYFCKAAEELNFDVYGIEVSNKLVRYSKDVVGFEKVFKSYEDANIIEYDAILLSDVIEHILPVDMRNVMNNMLLHLKRGGLLIGNTPNIKSANILICKEKDPVIAPPSHCCYFSLKTLDRYLQRIGLSKVKLWTSGLSTNSFFRKDKFTKSFIELSIGKVNKLMLPIYIIVKVLFKYLGYVIAPFGLGYQIYFVYKK